jgi:hypothetical protein
MAPIGRARLLPPSISPDTIRWNGRLTTINSSRRNPSRPSPERKANRWGTERGYCVVMGQKVPVERPRVRSTDDREIRLGSFGELAHGFTVFLRVTMRQAPCIHCAVCGNQHRRALYGSGPRCTDRVRRPHATRARLPRAKSVINRDDEAFWLSGRAQRNLWREKSKPVRFLQCYKLTGRRKYY